MYVPTINQLQCASLTVEEYSFCQELQDNYYYTDILCSRDILLLK